MLDEIREHVDRAMEHLGRGSLAEASAAFEEAVRLAPGHVALRQRLAAVYIQMGHRAHALAEFQHIAGRYAAEGELFKAISVCNMSGAVAAQEPAPDLDLESLELLRPGAHLPPPAAQEPVPPPPPDAVEIDLGPLPPSPLFSALDNEAFAALVQSLDLRWMSAGEKLIEEGQRGESMFVVVQGVVDVLRGDKVIAEMGEGSFFGEMALVTDSPRLASVTAARNGLLFEVHRSRVAEIAARHPSFANVLDAFYRDRLLANVLRASPAFRPLSV